MNKLILIILITILSNNVLADERKQDVGKLVEDGLVTGMNVGINAIGRVFNDQVVSPLDKALTRQEHLNQCQKVNTENCKKNTIQRIK